MGTNYYAVKRKPCLCNKPIHIGKSSYGWKFLFHGYQGEININSVEDWKNFLKDNEYAILNEYDDEINYIDFFNAIEEKQKRNNPNDFNNCANINGYRFSYRDFC